VKFLDLLVEVICKWNTCDRSSLRMSMRCIILIYLGKYPCVL
jgi:hypothetical protein